MVGGVQGLAEHRDELGAPLCPCRHYDDKVAEAKQGFWNCPCVPMRERKVKVNGVLLPVGARMLCLTLGGQRFGEQGLLFAAGMSLHAVLDR